MPKHIKSYSDVELGERGYIGEIPKAALAIDAHSISSYLQHWHVHGPLIHYVGPPDKDMNGGVLSSGEYTFDNDFYVIFRLPVKYDTSNPNRPLMMSFLPWQTRQWDGAAASPRVGNQPELTWYPDYTDSGTSYSLWPRGGTSDFHGEDLAAYGDMCHESPIDIYDPSELYVTPNADWVMGCAKLEVTQWMTANLLIAYAPEKYLTDADERISAEDLAVGRSIRGHSSTDVRSLGGLIHQMDESEKDNATESIESLGRRCLFQWGHPVCVYVGTGAQTDLSVFNTRIASEGLIVRPRNWRNVDGTNTAHPALVVKGGANGDSLKMSSLKAADSWTYTFTSTLANYTLIKDTDGGTSTLDVNFYEDDEYTHFESIKLEVTKGAGSEIEIKTVALFEGYSGG